MSNAKLLIVSAPADSRLAPLAKELGRFVEVTEFSGATASGSEPVLVLDSRKFASTVSAAGADRVVLVVPPELDLASLDPFAAAPGRTPIHKLVLLTPYHHLYARERLKLPPQHAELIPPAIDHHFWTPATSRSVNVVVIPALHGIHWETLLAADLHRDAKVRILHAPGERSLIPSAVPSAVSVAEVDPSGLRDAFREAAAVVVACGDRESGAGWEPLLQAMSCGAPIVAARTWGLEHLIVDELEGLLHTPRHTAELRAAVRRLIAEQDLAARFGRNARAKVTTTLTVEHLAARLARICAPQLSSDSPEFFLIASHGRAELSGVAS